MRKLCSKSAKTSKNCGKNAHLVQISSCFSWNQLKSADFRRRSPTKTALTFDSEEISPSNFCYEYLSTMATNSTTVGGKQKNSQIYRSNKPQKTRKTSILRRNQEFLMLCISDSRSDNFFLFFSLNSPSNFIPVIWKGPIYRHIGKSLVLDHSLCAISIY